MPGSTSRSIRSRAGSLPRERWRSSDFSPPPAATSAVRSRSSSTSACIRAAAPLERLVARDMRRQHRHAVSNVTRTAPERHLVSDAHVDRSNAGVVRRRHDLLHLHRLEDDERLVRLDGVALLDADLDHLPRHRATRRARRRRRPAEPVRAAASTSSADEERRGRQVEPPGAVPGARRGRARRGGERRVARQEVDRDVAGAEGRMGDEPAEERQVRRDALDDGLRERRLEPFERLVAVVAEARSAWRSSGRSSRRPRRLPRSPRRRGRSPAAGGGAPGRAAAGTSAGPPRTGAPRSRDRASTDASPARVSPSATRSWSSTRSRPVTASVTGCSTWIRPFSSRKKTSSPSTRNSAVPALSYPSARAKATACSEIRSRSAGDRPGGGDSSTTFWWRRCTEQSRSPSASTVPWRSPISCTSTCRGLRR